jgi:predicted RNA-binding Zn-ribbon protein involved in translation (DUF1610 family)
LGDIDVKTQADAARRYTSLRRRYWRFFLGGLALFAALATPLFAFGERLNPVARSMLAVPLILGFLTCCMGNLVAWSSLMRFRCPRCGERFILSWSSSWPTAACKHCGLHLGQ